MRTAIFATLIAIGCMPPDDESIRERATALSEGNGWENGSLNGSLNGWNNSWLNGSLNGFSGPFIGGWANGWSNGSLNGFTNGSLNGWSNTWGNGWVNGTNPTSSSVKGDGSKWIKNVRVESGRVMADACINPSALGLASCPVDPDGTLQCCRRAMLLKGVYWANPDTNGSGRQVNWAPSLTVSDGTVQNGSVDTTIVLDPVYTVGGAQSCDRDSSGSCVVSHFWQLGGPGQPMYPDCSDAVPSMACNATNLSGQRTKIDAGIVSLQTEVRAIYVTSISALITTNGHYWVDLRWMTKGDHSQILVPDPSFTNAQQEARWVWGNNAYGGIVAKPYCYAASAPQRADPTLVSQVVTCSNKSSGPIATFWQ